MTGGARPARTIPRMFDSLSEKLQGVLGDLRGRGRLSEEDITKAMREIRLALLEADVNFKVVKEFVATVRERCLGADVMKSLTPGQQVVKIVDEELTALMGQGSSKLAFSGRPPTVILLAGLQGSGKTTASAKLALHLRKKDGKTPGDRRMRSSASRCDGSARAARQADPGARVPPRRHEGSGRRRALGARAGPSARARRPHRRHGGSTPRRRGPDGRARRDPQGDEADERPPRPRLDDRARTP